MSIDEHAGSGSHLAGFELPDGAEHRKIVKVTYTNHRGETAVRHILPLRIAFACNPWHPEWQWLLHCFDLEKQAHRTFAMKQISSWEPEEITDAAA